MSSKSRSRTAALVLSSFTAAACATHRTHQPSPSGDRAILTTLGVDTISIERLHYSRDAIESELISRTPTITRARYNARLDSTARVSRLTAERRSIGTGTPRGWTDASIEFHGDSVVSRWRDANGEHEARFIAPRAFPGGLGTVFDQELVLRWMRRSHVDTADVPIAVAGQSAAYPSRFTLIGPESATLGDDAAVERVHIDATGHVLALDGSATTIKIVAKTVRADVTPSVIASFIDAERRGRGLERGLSPAGVATMDVAGGTISIRYGRPSVRGREVWRHGVLGDTIWRTGANAATVLETPVVLAFGDKQLPAGKYSLWTYAPPNGGYWLIINGQAGQWGTEYHAERDVLRVPLVDEPAPAAEVFTISIEPGSPARIVLAWGTRRLIASFTPR